MKSVRRSEPFIRRCVYSPMKRFVIFFLAIAILYLASTLIPSRDRCSVEPLIVEKLRTIQKAEILYSITKGRGRFADLEDLHKVRLIDSELTSGERLGYRFYVELVGLAGNRFDLTATPIAGERSSTGEHSFYSNETMIIYRSRDREPPRAGLRNRVPESGSLLEDFPSRTSCLE